MVPLSCSGRHSLFFGGDDIERHDRQHRAVHRHRHRHLVERNLVEEDLHVFDRIDRHAGFADIAGDTLVVRIVPAMCRQIECDRQALLSRRQIAPVKGVRLLGGGEARVLTDRPRPHDVHRGVRAAQKRRDSGRVLVDLDRRARDGVGANGDVMRTPAWPAA